MKIAIMGGTFDPIHIGHLVAGSEVHTKLGLDAVVYMPAGDPWQKRDLKVSPAADRLAMVAAAVKDDDRFSVSDMEIRRSGPTYAVDSVKEWQLENPNDEIYWIVGSDALAGIPTWNNWEEFVSLAKIICVNRVAQEYSVPFEYVTVEMPEIQISATDLRARFASGLDAKYLVPDSVQEVIRERGLYKS